MNDNPRDPRSEPTNARRLVRTVVLPPAILLLLLAVVTVLLELAFAPTVGRETLRAFELFGLDHRTLLTCLFNLGLVLLFLVHLLVLAGTIQMSRMSGYRGAKIAALISLVPVLSPGYILGIPVAIWALVALRSPRVKEAFHGCVT